VGKRATTSRCKRATAVDDGTRTRIANCVGALDSDLGSNTAKKFGEKLCHFTSRVLVTNVGMSTP
jgi:hypothetical protein